MNEKKILAIFRQSVWSVSSDFRKTITNQKVPTQVKTPDREFYQPLTDTKVLMTGSHVDP